MDSIQVLTTNNSLQKYKFSGCTTGNNVCAPKQKKRVNDIHILDNPA